MNLYYQWARYTGTHSAWEGEKGPFNFPIKFSSNVYSIHLGLLNDDRTNPEAYDSEFQPRKLSTSQFYVYQQSYKGAPWFPDFFMISFGK